jgi:ribonuclease Z
MCHCSILRFDRVSYLFNCCDGTQRNALEQGIKFPKIKCIFYNSSQIDHYLGTYGFLMSRGEMNISRVFQLAKNLANDKKSKNEKEKEKKGKKPILNLIHSKNGENHNNNENNDNNIFSEIQQCLLYGPPNFSQNFIYSRQFCPVPLNKYLFEYDINTSAFICKDIFEEKSVPNPIQIFEDETISVIPVCINIDNNSSMSYICIPKQRNRSFNKKKALDLGLKPGPIFGKLAKGENVTLDNGKIITLNDVSDEPLPSSSLAILYIPTEEHMFNMINNEIINRYINKKLGDKYIYNINIIVHICPRFNIINNEKYISFMASFGKDVEHIIECPEINQQFMYNEGKIKIQYLLNKVSNILFPDPLFKEEETKSSLENKKEIFDNLSKNKGVNIDESIPGREYILYPPDKKGFVIKGLYQGNPYYFNSEDHKTFLKNISDIKINNIDNKINSFTQEMNYPKVTFLGTSSMKPGKFRNVSAILIENIVNNNKKYILFDCGEGTFQQIYEKFGSKITNQILLNLNLISITHKHGDHMLGIMKIIKEIDKLLILMNLDKNKIINEKLYIYIIVPLTIIDFVKNSINLEIEYKNYFKVFDSNMFNVNEIQYYKNNLLQDNPNENFVDIPRLSPINDYKNLCEKINIFRNKPELKPIYEDFLLNIGVLFNTIEVFHCEESFGLFIENNVNKDDPSYFKISFSGDTRPNNNFFNYSMHSTLFIHEGTFDSDMTEDALEKMHSTVGQAIKIGEDNLSKYIAITHFSPRYIKTYPYKEEFDKKKIIFSNDYLSFSLNELPVAHKYLKSFDEIINSIEGNKKKKNIL